MLGAPHSPLAAGIESCVVAAALLGFGYLLVDVFTGRRDLDRATRWALAVPAVVAWALVLQIAHMVSGGQVWSNPWVPRGLTLAAAAALIVLRVRGDRAPGELRDHLLAAGLMAAALIVWCTPVFRMVPLDFSGDTIFAAGWTGQLLNGGTTPSAPITGNVPNYYPWLFHALAALTARFTPGGLALYALGPLQILVSVGAVLGFFGLGRSLTTERSSAGFGALFGALAGGVGYVLLRGIDVIKSPRAGAGSNALFYQGDLLFRRSYNLAFHNLAPPFPRDLSYALFPVTLMLLVLGIRRGSVTLVALAGTTIGMLGLTGGEAFFVAAGVTGVTAILIRSPLSRWRILLWTALPAAVLWSLWVVPLAVSYVRLGGFQNITIVPPVDLPPLAVLVSWGLVTPLAMYGAWRWLPRIRTDPAPGIAVAVIAVAGALVIGSRVLPRLLGDAFSTLGRAHRYWPLVYGGVALFAAVGTADLVGRIRDRSHTLAAAAATAVVLLAVPSPIVGSLALPREGGTRPLVAMSLLGTPHAALARLADRGPGCVVAVPDPVTRDVFAYTGFRLVLVDGKAFREENLARIRWADIYEHIVPEGARIADNTLLTEGGVALSEWSALARRYGLTTVLAFPPAAAREPFPSLPKERVRLVNRDAFLVDLAPCRQ